MERSSNACSISFVNNPLPPACVREAVCRWSPVVLMISICVSMESSFSRPATWFACQSARAEPRDPSVTRLFTLTEPKYAPHSTDEFAFCGGRLVGLSCCLAPHLRNRTVRDFIDDRPGKCFDGLLLIFRQTP